MKNKIEKTLEWSRTRNNTTTSKCGRFIITTTKPYSITFVTITDTVNNTAYGASYVSSAKVDCANRVWEENRLRERAAKLAK